MKRLLGTPLCFLRGIWYSLKTGYGFGGFWVSGHEYIEQDSPPNVSVLICENCGHCSVSWSWHPIPDKKTGERRHEVNL